MYMPSSIATSETEMMLKVPLWDCGTGRMVQCAERRILGRERSKRSWYGLADAAVDGSRWLDGSRGLAIFSKGLCKEAAQAGGDLGRKSWQRLIWAWLVSMELLVNHGAGIGSSLASCVDFLDAWHGCLCGQKV